MNSPRPTRQDQAQISAGANLSGKRVLVTGANGFVGRHLVQELLALSEIKIRTLVRQVGSCRDLFPDDMERIDIVEGDLSTRNTLRGICADVDTVFHCAALGTSSAKTGATRDDYDRVNVLGSQAIAEEALKAGVRRFVHVSSMAAMGVPKDAVVNEASECRPSDPYQVSKRSAELALIDLLSEGPTELIVLRPCLVVGAGKQGGELLNLFRLCQKGLFPVFGPALESEKPLVSVKDLVMAMLLSSQRGRPGQIYLIHSGGGHKLRQILNTVGELVGRSKPYRRIPLPIARLAAYMTTPIFLLLGKRPPLTPERLALFMANRRIDITKAMTELGYMPKVLDLSLIFRPAYEFYRQTGQL